MVFSCHHQSPLNHPTLYPLALQPVLVSLETSPRVMEVGKMTVTIKKCGWVCACVVV